MSVMESREFTAKSVQEAIKKGLEEMNLAIDEADIDIVTEATSGIFGFGAKKAVVRITPMDDENIDVKKSLSEESYYKGKKSGVVDNVGDVLDNIEDKLEDIGEKAEEKLEAIGDKVYQAVENKKADDLVDANINSSEHVAFLVDFLDGLFEKMGLECTYEITQRGDTLNVNVKSNDSGKLIGHRGETLDSIQYITRLAIHKTDLPYRSIIVQTENYREKREQTLRNLAGRLATKVERTGRRVTLEPMKPYERRIIHETLQDNPNVKTSSEGVEPNRHVVVSPNR